MRPREDSGYRADIDGLRAIAVLAVVGYHAFPAVVPGGFVGVDVFFVISGYLIATIALSGMRDGRFSLASFYLRRMRRIFPALFLMLAAGLIAGWFLLLPDEYRLLAKHAAASVGFGLNILLEWEPGYFGALAAEKPLLHLWSLGIEEQFYLVFPAFLLLVRWLRLNVLACLAGVLVASFLINIVWIGSAPRAAFYLPMARAWELLTGCVLAALTLNGSHLIAGANRPLVGNLLSVAGAGLVLAAAFLLTGRSSFPGWLALLPVVGAALTIAAGRWGIVNRTLLVRRPIVYVGLISYPLYLWHWPLLSFARILWLEVPPWEVRLVLVTAAFVAAVLTYEFVEKPIRFGSRRLRFVALASPMVLVGSLALAVFLGNGFASRFGASFESGSDLYEGRLAAVRSPACHFRAEMEDFGRYEKRVDLCLATMPDRPNVAVFGDSHGADLWAALSSGYPEVNFLQMTGNGCPPFAEASFAPNTAAGCAEFVRAMKIRLAQKDDLDGIVLGGRWEDDFRGVDAEIGLLAALGIPVAVFGPTYEFTADAPKIEVRARDIDATGFTGLHLDARRWDVDAEMAAFFAERKIPYLSKLALLCHGRSCPIEDGNGKLYVIDYGHWSAHADRVFGAEFRKARVLETALGLVLAPPAQGNDATASIPTSK